MSKEINIQVSMSCTNAGFELMPMKRISAQVDQMTAGKHCTIFPIGTTESLLSFVYVMSAGYALLRNLDDTNYVELGVKPDATFIPMLRLLPGGAPQLVRFTEGLELYAKADTSDCLIEIDLLNS